MTTSSPPLTFRAAAERVLAEAGTPLTAAAITERALASNLLATGGKTPAATMEAQLATSIQKHGAESTFVRVAPRVYALRQWIAEGTLVAPESGPDEVRIPHFPSYEQVRAVLPALAGMTRADVTGLQAAILEHTGTPDEAVDWSDPDAWISGRLTGEHREAAARVWLQSGRRVNPRYLSSHWLLASGYDLLETGAGGLLSITARGRDFLEKPSGVTVRDLDAHEGLLKLLAIVAEHGAAALSEFLPAWMEFLHSVSRMKSENTGRTALYHRLRNLAERGYIERSGQRYQVAPAGLAYLKSSEYGKAEPAADEMQRLRELADAQRRAVRKEIRERLGKMHPYAFEHVVKRLLEEMGYIDVMVTTQSNDKGVDVVGTIQLGITSVREVVQAKRQQGNVQRKVLDELRGSLHRFKAIRGTIITTADFSRGAVDAAVESGGAPITLIDGEKLADLLIQYGIGARKRQLDVLELVPEVFAGEGVGE